MLHNINVIVTPTTRCSLSGNNEEEEEEPSPCPKIWTLLLALLYMAAAIVVVQYMQDLHNHIVYTSAGSSVKVLVRVFASLLCFI